MGYILFDRKTTRIISKEYRTHAAAQAQLTRMGKGLIEDADHPKFKYGIADVEYYARHIERQVVRTNLMTGKEYTESVNTPIYMSPSSETYWSM